jgi:methyltransferase
VIAIIALIAVLVMMLGELWLSKTNERALLRRGAIEAETDDAIFRVMRLAYPGVFIAMAVEGAMSHAAADRVAMAGVGVMAMAKALKFWAIASLGPRWSYRVLVLPGVPLVTSGPYRLMRHPNYVGVMGELLGMALMTHARMTGPLGMVFFGWLLLRRIAAEDRAMGIGRGLY